MLFFFMRVCLVLLLCAILIVMELFLFILYLDSQDWFNEIEILA